jgi:two-component sensor histidine kinase/ActR/RegA family two-component response regulator
MRDERVNILLVDDQPAKLLSYQVILEELGENLIQAKSGKEALEILLKKEIAVVLVDVCMPDLDGFELASMIRKHPRFRDVAIIFISAVHLADSDSLRGYEMGAVDYVPVPVVPGVLRAKVRVFVDLYRKTRELAAINAELERRVAERTAELEQAIERQKLLAREVDHRAKNAFAVIQSIVSLTRRRTPQDFAAAIQGRITAMARAHRLLSETHWDGADLASLIRDELAPYREGARAKFEGPHVMLAPSAAQTIAIAIHELATNAAKYGALSVLEGKVSVAWRMDEMGVKLVWRETGGPEVKTPEAAGFGTSMIAASMRSHLAGQVVFDWRPEGLVCTIRIPSSSIVPPRPAGEEQVSEIRAERPSGIFNGARVLLVEDEPLVGMMMTEVLASLGLEVTGPIASLSGAMEFADRKFDAALLDVNLGGELVYPLADALTANGAQLIFLTGYEPASIAAPYRRWPILQKPIDSDRLKDALHDLLEHGERSAQRAG